MKQAKMNIQRNSRKKRVRYHLKENDSRPRLHVFRSNKYMYAQIIDDNQGKTLAAATQQQLKDNKGSKTEKAAAVGKLIAERAKKQGITKVKFDRGYYKYHGRVAAVAKAARENGLEF